MGKRTFFGALLVMVCLTVLAPVAFAQRVVGVQASYVWGVESRGFTSPPNFFGNIRDTSGIDVDGVVTNKSGLVAFEGRFQHLSLRNARYISRDSSSGMRNEYRVGDFSGGSKQYYEASGSFTLAKIRHDLIAGVAVLRSTENFGFGEGSMRATSTRIGPVFGLAGAWKVGDATVLGYSGRIYPRLARTDKFFSGKEVWGSNINLADSGFELRGVVTHWIFGRVGVTGGCYWRRFRQNVPASGQLGNPEISSDRACLSGTTIKIF